VNLISFIVPVSHVLTSEEAFLCREFFRQIGLDYGEIDVLRDGIGGKIYIVDANNTPAGPTKSLPKDQRRRAIALYGEGVSKGFFGSHY